MPISVACTCGKTFRVRDELAGQSVTCQVCGASVLAGAVAVADQAAIPTLVQATPRITQSETIACPACAEAIPRKSIRCPYCKEVVNAGKLSDSQKISLLSGLQQSLDGHNAAMDDDLRGGLITLTTMITGGLAFCCIVLFMVGIAAGNGGEVAIGFGVIFGIIFGIAFLVSLYNDYQTHHIQNASSAEQALKRFVLAQRTGRAKKAYAALSPLARQASGVESIRFNNPKVAKAPGLNSYHDPESYAKYCKTIYRGPSGIVRTVAVKSIRALRTTPDGVAIVELKLGITSYSKWLYLALLVHLLLCLILIFALQAKDEVVVRKALIQHRGRWYIVDGAFSGDIDRALA